MATQVARPYAAVKMTALRDVGLNTEWVKEGTCLQERHPTELFFPPKGNVPHIVRAKAICNRCPVKAECLEWALAVPERIGIWGGTTEYERRKLRGPGTRRRRCKTCQQIFMLPTNTTVVYCSDECRHDRPR